MGPPSLAGSRGVAEPAARATRTTATRARCRPGDTTAACRVSAPESFDRVICSDAKRRWDLQTKSPGGLHVDHQLEPGGLLDGQNGGVCAFEDLRCDETGLPPHCREAGSIGHEPTTLYVLLPLIDGGKPVACRLVHD